MENPIDSKNNSYIHQLCYYNTIPQTIATPQYPNDIHISKKNNVKFNLKYYLGLLCCCFIKNEKDNIR